MSHILSAWVRTETGIENLEPSELDQRFSSGYLFGKLLSSLGYETNFSENYVQGTTTDAFLKNYTSLELTLRERLKIKLSSNNTVDLIAAKPGTAIRLLYEIKTKMDHLGRPEKKLAKKIIYDSYPSSPVAGASTNIESIKKTTNISPLEVQTAIHFSHLLKSKLKRTNQFVGKKFEDKPPIKNHLPPIPITRKEKAASIPAQPQAKQRAYKAAPARVEPESIPEKSVSEKKQQATLDIELFEQKLLENEYKELDTAQVSSFMDSRAALNAATHLEVLKKELQRPMENIHLQSELYRERLKISRLEGESARKAQQKTRRKQILLSQQLQKQIEQRQLDFAIEQRLLRQSKQERRIADQLTKVRHEKEVMIQNRIYREEQYAAQRQKEYEEALQRESELYKNAEKEYRHATILQMDQHEAILAEKKAKKHEKNCEFAKELVDLIVTLSINVSEYKKLSENQELTEKKMREWIVLLRNNLPLKEAHDRSDEIPIEKDGITPSGEEVAIVANNKPLAIPEHIKVLDAEDFDDYLKYNGVWNLDIPMAENPTPEYFSDNYGEFDSLAKIVDDLFTLTLKPMEKSQVATLPAVPLRIAMVGRHYAGKASVAKYLGAKYNMSILNMTELIADTLANADQPLKRKTTFNVADGKKKDVNSKHQIGIKMQTTMAEGQPPDDSLLVALIIDAMSTEPEKPGGWIILDFPNTKNQAQLLEKELSGYEDPKPIKKGDLKRTKDRASTAPRNRSLIANSATSTEILCPPISAIDAIFLLEVPAKTTVGRALGRVIDPLTGKKNHIEFNPPSLTEPGTIERLAKLAEAGNGHELLPQSLVAAEEEEATYKEWLQQFKSLHIIEANRSTEKTSKKVESILTDIISKINLANPREIGNESELAEKESNSELNLRISSSKPGTAKSKPSSTKSFEGEKSLRPSRSLIATPMKHLPTKEFGMILIDQWRLIESNYTETMKYALRSIRRLRDDSLQYYYDVKLKFGNFLKRPDVEQDLVETFQVEYNAIEDDFRADNDVKAELHQRVEELKERIWEISDRRREEAEAERLSIIEDRWPEDQSYNLVNYLITILQAEVDRFLATRQFILDFYRDSNSVLFYDIPKNNLKLEFLSPNNQPPIEIASALIAMSQQQTTQRKDIKDAVAKDLSKPTNLKETKDVKKDLKRQNKSAEPKYSTASPATVEKDQISVLDPESENFVEFYNAIDMILGALQNELSLEAVLAQDTKDMRKSTPVDDQDKPIPPISHRIIETEELLLKTRIKVVRKIGSKLIKDLRNRALDIYMTLDEWIGQRYQTEIEISKDLANLIKEAIEAEQRLPNYLALQGEQLRIDFSQLLFEPKAEPAPSSPTEKPHSDQFTVLQLKNLALQLKKIAPTGVISVKNMVDLLAKLSVLKSGYDALPEGFNNADYSTIMQVVGQLDPFETGFINWQKFLMLCARLLPIGDQIVEETLELLKSVSSKDEFMEKQLWFERDREFRPDVFDRPGKLKEAIYEIFVIPDIIPASPEYNLILQDTMTRLPSVARLDSTTPFTDSSVKTPALVLHSEPRSVGSTPIIEIEDKPDEKSTSQILPMMSQVFNLKEFMFCCCADETPESALQKAFKIIQDENGKATLAKCYEIFVHFLHIVKSTDRVAGAEDFDNPYPYEAFQQFASKKLPELFTFNELVEAIAGSPLKDWLDCPFYSLEDLTIGSSRPSSGADNQLATPASKAIV